MKYCNFKLINQKGVKMKKMVLFAFNSDISIFALVMMNALDMKAKGNDKKIAVDTGATKFFMELLNEKNHLLTFLKR